MAQMYYEHAFMERIRTIYPKGNISEIHQLPDNTAHAILIEILETGCQSGNYANIQIANDALALVPSWWLYEHLPRVVPVCLFKESEWREWEFRRLAEMLKERFPDSFTWLLDYAKELHDPEVDDAIQDFL